MQASGGSRFDDLVVLAAGVRLLQRTGRGIRTETDTTRITCFDRRLTESSFGRRMLSGLPPYPVRVEQRAGARREAQRDPASSEIRVQPGVNNNRELIAIDFLCTAPGLFAGWSTCPSRC